VPQITSLFPTEKTPKADRNSGSRIQVSDQSSSFRHTATVALGFVCRHVSVKYDYAVVRALDVRRNGAKCDEGIVQGECLTIYERRK